MEYTTLYGGAFYSAKDTGKEKHTTARWRLNFWRVGATAYYTN